MRKSININNKNVLKNEFYKCMKEAGFDGCDIDLTNNFFMSDENWEKNTYKIKELLEKNGLSCIQVHLPCDDPFVSSEVILDDTKKAILNAIKATKILSCEWGAYHPKTSFKDNFNPKTSLKDNIREISIYLEEAEKQGVGIAIENIPIHPDCPQYRFFSSDYEDLNELTESFKSDKIGICWDFGHANLMGFRQEKAFELLGEKIKIVHIANNYRFIDDHNMPTFGYVDWKSVMPAFYKCGYKGDFNLEVRHPCDNVGLSSFYKHGIDCLCMLEEYFKQKI